MLQNRNLIVTASIVLVLAGTPLAVICQQCLEPQAGAAYALAGVYPSRFVDLAQVPEVRLQDADIVSEGTIAEINRCNAESIDRFVEKLRQGRRDLAGLPFVLGGAARLQPSESAPFGAAVADVRAALQTPSSRYDFWNLRLDQKLNRARIAARMQMLAVEPPLVPGLIEQLSNCNTAEATQALVRLAIFSPEDWLRCQALAVLRNRDTTSATEILRRGLRYPWPAVVNQTVEAIAQLGRRDLAAQLADSAGGPDPRLPALQEVDGTKVYVLRELVRINHLRNCLLCHPPATSPNMPFEGKILAAGLLANSPLVGEIPDPNQPATLWATSRRPIINLERAVRADVTYLRQDFSRSLKVAEGEQGPVLQRFDFLVRKRILTEAEAEDYRSKLALDDAVLTARDAFWTVRQACNVQNLARLTFGVCLAFAVLLGLRRVRRSRAGAARPQVAKVAQHS